MTSFPTSVKSFSTLVNDVDSVLAAHPNERADEITAIENYLIQAATEVTVSGGTVVATLSRHKLQPASGTAGTVTTITGMPSNSHLTLYASDAGTDTLTFQHGTGNISCFGTTNIALSHGFVNCFYAGTTVYVAGGGGSSGTTTTKGRAEILSSFVPATSGAPLAILAGASTPAEQIPYFEFVDASTTYIDLYCRLIGYNSGGLTVNFEVMRTSAAAAEYYTFGAAIRRINTGTETLASSHTYNYNTSNVTVPAGPPAATIPMAGTITFTDGSDMDSLETNEAFILRIERVGGSDTANDVARVLSTITIRET